MIKTKNLTKELNAIAPAVIGNKGMTILSCVKIDSVGDNKINIIGSNLEMQIEILADAEFDNELSMCIDAEKLIKFSRSNKDIDLKITQSKTAGDKVVLKSNSTSTINTLKADTFPDMQVNLDNSVTVKLDAQDLNYAFNSVLYAVADKNKEARDFLTGVSFKISGSKLKLTGSDGSRLSTVEIDLDIDNDIDIECIIPVKTAQTMTKTFVNGEVELLINNSSMQVSDGVVKITGKNIDAKFPDFSKAFNVDRPNHALIDVSKLVAGIESVLLTTNDLSKGVKVTFGDNNINLIAENPEGEKSEVDIECEYFGKPISLGVNAEYLIQSIKKFKDEISINIADEKNLTITNDGNAVHLLMSMNL